MTTPAIEYKDAEKIYIKSHLGKKTRAVGIQNLDLKVEKGEIFGLLGLNGAGKTTAMKLILGLLFPTNGKVSVNGIDTAASSAKIKNLIGYLPEMAYFNTSLTAYQTVKFFSRLSNVKKTKEEIYDILKLTGLENKENTLLKEFSKGMLQRVGLAQSFIHNPDILVLDEPVSGLDPLAIHDFRNIIQKVNSKGTTVFLSSHSISEMEKVCHRTGILVNGTLKRTVNHEEWSSTEGGLEKIFVETVR